ncbi:GGDEF domain-containing protein [Clostridium sp. LBM24168]
MIAFMSLFQHFYIDKVISQKLSLNSKIVLGLFNAILGIVLMINSVQITYDKIIDFRYIPILLSSLYGGFLCSIVTSIIIGIFRFLFLGVSSTSIFGLIAAFLVGIGFGLIALLKLSKKIKYIYSMVYFVVVLFILTLATMQNVRMIIKTLSIFFPGYLVVSYISIKYADCIMETAAMYRKLENEAAKDYLTGLNNVRQFNKKFNSISQLAIHKEEDLSLLLIDIDFFKEINDTYGHDIGDSVLKDLAHIFLDTCRTYDVVSRNGGEEFSILLLDCPASKAVKIAEKLRKNVEKNDFYILGNKTINITISIGISSYPELTKQVSSLLKSADIALYQAKSNGRNKVALFNEEKIL